MAGKLTGQKRSQGPGSSDRGREAGTGLIPVSGILPGMEDLQGLVPDRAKPVVRVANKAKPKVPPPAKDVSKQARHHYTRMKQVVELSRIGEAEQQDMGFIARMLTLCSLPRTNPGDRAQYKRQNGPYKLIMIAGGTASSPMAICPGC